MSTTTTNYNLIKPELTDAADITAMNENWDKLDAELKRQADSTPDVSGQIEAHNKSDKSHQDIRSAVSKSLADAKSYTDEKIAEIPEPDTSKVDNHISNKNNPHKVTATQVGAVAKTGDTMTGDLHMEGDDPLIWFENKTLDRQGILGHDYNTKEFYICNKKTNDYENLVSLILGAQDAPVNELLTLYHANSGTAYTYNVLHTGNLTDNANKIATALGAPKMQIVSYTGNGVEGYNTNPSTDSKANKVTFSFAPKIIMLVQGKGSYEVTPSTRQPDVVACDIVPTNGTQRTFTWGGDGTGATCYMQKSSDGKTFYWTGSSSYSSAGVRANVSGYTYYVVAFG